MYTKDKIESEALKAASILRDGGIILCPTDTIWGLGCCAGNKTAADRINKLKKRPEGKNFIVLVNDLELLQQYAIVEPWHIEHFIKHEEGKKPETIIYKAKKSTCPLHLVSERNEIAVRLIHNDFLDYLLASIGEGLISTSANFSGKSSSFSFSDIEKELKNQVDYTVDLSEYSTNTTASKIIRINKNGIEILRD